jgi:hypothetical protein
VDQEVLDAALIEVGAVTLSPTWDAIMFAEGPAASAAVVPAVPAPVEAPTPVEATSQLELPAQLEIPAPPDVSAPLETTTLAAMAQAQGPEPPVPPAPHRAVDYFPKESEFQKEVEDWVQEDLAPPARPTPVFYEAGVRSTPTSQRRVRVRVDWPRGVRSETYVQKVSRTWAARIAIGMAAFLAVNIMMAGAFTLLGGLRPSAPPALPALPAAPAKQLPSVELPDRTVEPSAAGVVFVGNDARSAGEDDAGTQ